MKLKIILLFCLFIITHPGFSQENELMAYLDALDTSLEVSMMVEDDKGQVVFQYNANKVVPSASVIKIPILVELMRQAQSYEIDLEEEYVLDDKDKVGGSGELQHSAAGRVLTIEQLAVEMIRISDNTATNVLISRIGMERINQTLTSNGFDMINLNRLMMDFEAIKQGRQNHTSAGEMNRLLRLVLTHQILNPEFSEKAIEILLKCEDSSAIPRYLPAATQVAHKTGTLDYVRGDAGIIMGDEPLILTIFVEKFRSTQQAEEVIGDLAKIVYDLRFD